MTEPKNSSEPQGGTGSPIPPETPTPPGSEKAPPTAAEPAKAAVSDTAPETTASEVLPPPPETGAELPAVEVPPKEPLDKKPDPSPPEELPQPPETGVKLPGEEAPPKKADDKKTDWYDPIVDWISSTRYVALPLLLALVVACFCFFGLNILPTTEGSKVELQVIAAAQQSKIEGPSKPPTGAKEGEAKDQTVDPKPEEKKEGLPDKEKGWTITGRVLDMATGEPVNEASVYIIGYDNLGNGLSPKAVKTDLQGEFQVGPLPESLGRDTTLTPIRTIKISAQKKVSGWLKDSSKKGELLLSVDYEYSRHLRPSQFAAHWLTFPLTCFLATLLAVWLMPATAEGEMRVHFLALLLTLALTVCILMLIINAIWTFSTLAQSGERRSMGVATFFEGTYVAELDNEWLVSLTSPGPPTRKAPPEAGDKPAKEKSGDDPAKDKEELVRAKEIAHGLGAPFWVIFVSVLGACLLTVGLVIREICAPPPFGVPPPPDATAETTTELRKRLRTLLEHQFFVLFAPLGGIFLYQLLLAAKAASQPVFVGIVILGAGATLNILLIRAVRLAEQWMQGAKEEKEK